MINGKLDQFLDTGWYTESTLFYNGHIYWCEGDTDPRTGISKFFVIKWRAETDDNILYHTVCDKDDSPIDYEKILEITGDSLEKLKKEFLESKVFDGLSFWQVEQKLAWLDEGEKIIEASDVIGK